MFGTNAVDVKRQGAKGHQATARPMPCGLLRGSDGDASAGESTTPPADAIKISWDVSRPEEVPHRPSRRPTCSSRSSVHRAPAGWKDSGDSDCEDMPCGRVPGGRARGTSPAPA